MQVVHWGEQIADAAARSALESAIVDLLSPAVLEYLPADLSLTGDEDAIEDWIAERDEAGQVYTVRLAGSSDLLGLLFLALHTDGDDEDEDDEANPSQEDDSGSAVLMIGYIIAEPEWGQGYASELVEGVLGGLDELGHPTVRAGVANDNDASARVLIKNGFTLKDSLSSDHLDMFEL
ncbi:MAG: GNAT family N-acetyltransferase [Planktotalea sp.]